jgi:hypothetical protein
MFTPGSVEHYINEHRQEAEQLATHWRLIQTAHNRSFCQAGHTTIPLRIMLERFMAALRTSRAKSKQTSLYVADVVIDTRP